MIWSRYYETERTGYKMSNKLKTTEEIIKDNIEYHNKYGKLYQENIEMSFGIKKLKEENAKLASQLYEVWNSRTWKYTKPIRYINRKLKRTIPIQTNKKVEIDNDLINSRISSHNLLKQLSDYDVISFDIFDTLILRNVTEPTDLFRLVGGKLGIENFETYRVNAEKEARENTKKRNQEINIYDIYQVLEKYIKIDKQKAIAVEFEVEKDFCISNPYLKPIYDKLLEQDKAIIITSDMYWTKEYLIKLLASCGYDGFKDIFVSCEYQENKGSSKLQEIAYQKVGKQYKYIHIGDNYLSDIEGSKKINWSTYYYPKCKDISNYDTINNSIVSSINKAIIDNYFYSKDYFYNPYFEYGFKYAGLLVCGFCEWLDDYAKKNGIDKFLFLARDMDIVHQVYKKFYHNFDSEYIVISRSAALELNFDDMPEEFIEFYFKPRINTKETLETMLIDSDLEVLLDKLKSSSFKPTDVLTDSNYLDFKNFIYQNKKIISEYFNSSKIAAKKYLEEKIGKSKNIAIIDLGWSGQIFIQLRHFITKNIDKKIKLTGAYIANSNSKKVNYYIESGIMNSYLFSYASNNDLLLNTATYEGNTKAMFLEAMFSSKEATLLKYRLDENQDYQFVYGISSSNNDLITGVQEGIIEFANFYHKITKKYGYLKISSVDAYTPFHRVSSNYSYNYSIFKDTKEYLDSLPRFHGKRNMTTIGEIIKSRNLL